MKLMTRSLGLASLGLASTLAYSGIVPPQETLKMPRCLADALHVPVKRLVENKDFAIVQVERRQMDALAKETLDIGCGKYTNLQTKTKTQSLTAANLRPLLKEAKPQKKFVASSKYSIKHQEQVNKALEHIVPANIEDMLTKMVSFYNRSAYEKNGLDTAIWLKERFDGMVTQYGRDDTNSYFVETGWFKQPSLVTVLGKDKPGEGIVIGAHMDTLGGRMPGAGDDGSGSSSIMEMLRVLMETGFKPQRPIYFIWYAAEERGLVGSQYVVQHFMDEKIPVKAAIQFDMTGYRNDGDDRTMWLFKDYTDKALTAFNAELIKTYVKVPVKYSRCGYGCSDHASWMAEGIPAAFPCETSFEAHNPYIHSPSDTMDLLYLDHMTNFTKLGLAFAIELASE